MSLAPSGDLLGFSNTAYNAEIDPGVVDQFRLNQFTEFPLCGEMLSCRQRSGYMLTESMEGSRIF